jgi:PAS domain S-box-containing protein
LPGTTDFEDLEDLFENAPCGYLSVSSAGNIFKVNATFCAWTGFDKTALVGQKFQSFLNIAGRIYFETHFAPLLRMQGFFHEVALDVVARDGTPLPVLVNAVEKRSEHGQALFVRMTIFNATDRRRYERDLLAARAAAENASTALRELNATLERRISEAVAEQLKAEERLRQAQKMEAIGQLTGGVAHDFNNLLTIIIGGLDTIGRQIVRFPESHDMQRLRRAKDMALHGAQRAAALTAKLLAFSRRQPLAPKAIDVNALIRNVADLLQRTLGETVAFESVATAGLWRAMVDEAELENVLINLAVNARDAMPNGGKLTIETGNAALDEAYIAALTEPVSAGQYVLIAVSDTGTGMEAATLDRVFEPFFTTKEVGKGTGLGLSQVYGFVRQTGGHIRLYSEPGHGTTVKLYLPRAPGTQKDDPATPLFTTSGEGGPETILVVEDDAALREFSAGALAELGYNVLAARSGKDALDLLDANAPIDLLFTDVVLPDGMNGRELANEAARKYPGLKILFTTGYTANAIVHHGTLDAGVNLLSKPFTFESLARKVRALLG